MKFSLEAATRKVTAEIARKRDVPVTALHFANTEPHAWGGWDTALVSPCARRDVLDESR